MQNQFPNCPRCKTPFYHAEVNTGGFAPCPGCGTATRVDTFPALFRPVAVGKAGEAIMVDGEAGCFYHPHKRASVHCEACGRFLCALCDVELNGQHLCPSCLETGQRKGKIVQLENKRILYDGMAMTTALLPLLVWPVTIATGPLAIGMAIYGWNKPGSLVPRTRVRAVLAIFIGLLQMVGWGFLIYNMVNSP